VKNKARKEKEEENAMSPGKLPWLRKKGKKKEKSCGR
jgi:hypothetical protein